MYEGSSSSAGAQSSRDYSDLYNEKIKEIDALIASFPKEVGNGSGEPPDSSLGSALNNMMVQWNSLLSQIVTEVDHPQQILEHIKETAEFSVKQFRDACLEMNSELTRVSMDWQLNNAMEMSKQEIAEYETSIQRQTTLLTNMRKKLEEEVLSAENLSYLSQH